MVDATQRLPAKQINFAFTYTVDLSKGKKKEKNMH